MKENLLNGLVKEKISHMIDLKNFTWSAKFSREEMHLTT